MFQDAHLASVTTNAVKVSMGPRMSTIAIWVLTILLAIRAKFVIWLLDEFPQELGVSLRCGAIC